MTSDARKGANEGWFREVNERLEHRAAVQEASGRQFEIVCECVREECTERIAITFADYERVRAEAKTFIVRSGHVDPSCERVVSSTPTCDIVEKFGQAGMDAEVQNPRDG